MTKAQRSAAPADRDTNEWWEGTTRKELLLQCCDHCGNRQHYPRAICVSCGGDALSMIATSGQGIIETFTVLHRSPSPSFATPYVVAMIRLREGPIILSSISNCDVDDVRIGLDVTVAWEPLDDGRNLPVFTPTP